MSLKKNKNSGYVLILSLMITSALTILITSIYNKVSVYIPYTRALNNQEKAKMLALSGIEIAAASLENIFNIDSTSESNSVNQDNKLADNNKSDAKENKKDNRLDLIELLNRWQTFNLDEKDNNTVDIYISSQQGKINLSNIYDIDKKKYRIDATSNVDAGKFLESLGKIGLGISKELPDFLQKKEFNIQDISELITLRALSDFKNKLFLQKDVDPPFLFDLFCAEETGVTVNPFLFSKSIKNILGFKDSDYEKNRDKNNISKILNNISPGSSLESVWDNGLNQLYGKLWKDIPENVRKLFTIQFDYSLFSVVSYAKVGSITQKVYAVLQEERIDKKKVKYVIKRIYWI